MQVPLAVAYWCAFWCGFGGDEEPFCETLDLHCTDVECVCVPDRLVVTFRSTEGSLGSTLEYESFNAGANIAVAVVAEVKSDKVQAFSYGVKHDAQFLTLDEKSVTTAGTIVDPKTNGSPFMDGFNTTMAVPGGWISAVILSFAEQPPQLSRGTNVVGLAEYSLKANPGVQGTLVKLVHKKLAKPGSQPFQITIHVDRKLGFPDSLVHGIVRQKVTLFHRGDSDNDGKIGISDATYLLAYAGSWPTPSRLRCWAIQPRRGSWMRSL